MSENAIPFIDLKTQQHRCRSRLEAAIARVLDHGAYIMGPEVRELEQRLGAITGARHVVTCANGTDALTLTLMAEDIGPGDAVFVPAFTFVAPAEVVPLLGATPIFVDVCDGTFNLDSASLDSAIEVAKRNSLRPRAVIAVDLFGQPADYMAIDAVAEAHGLLVIADAAQAMGSAFKGRNVGTLAKYTSTSFFPTKPLGCYGDGGAVFTDDDEKAALLRSLRAHGKGGDKYDNVRLGMNSRLDTLQAAILVEKLNIFEDEIEARRKVAERYKDGLFDVVEIPVVEEGARTAWAQFTIRTDHRDRVAAHLKERGIPTAIYYPTSVNRQVGYRGFLTAPEGVPVSEGLSARVLSLPMHPYLQADTQQRIVSAMREALGSSHV